MSLFGSISSAHFSGLFFLFASCIALICSLTAIMSIIGFHCSSSSTCSFSCCWFSCCGFFALTCGFLSHCFFHWGLFCFLFWFFSVWLAFWMSSCVICHWFLLFWFSDGWSSSLEALGFCDLLVHFCDFSEGVCIWDSVWE